MNIKLIVLTAFAVFNLSGSSQILEYFDQTTIHVESVVSVNAQATNNDPTCPPPNGFNLYDEDSVNYECQLTTTGAVCTFQGDASAKTSETCNEHYSNARSYYLGDLLVSAETEIISVTTSGVGDLVMRASDSCPPDNICGVGGFDQVGAVASGRIGMTATNVFIPFIVTTQSQINIRANAFLHSSIQGHNHTDSMTVSWNLSPNGACDWDGAFAIGAGGVDNFSDTCIIEPGAYTLEVDYSVNHEANFTAACDSGCPQAFAASGAVSDGFSLNLSFGNILGGGN